MISFALRIIYRVISHFTAAVSSTRTRQMHLESETNYKWEARKTVFEGSRNDYPANGGSTDGNPRHLLEKHPKSFTKIYVTLINEMRMISASKNYSGPKITRGCPHIIYLT